MTAPMEAGAAPARRQALRGHAAMALFALVISGSFSLGDRAVEVLDPGALMAARFLVAALATALVAGPLFRRAHLAAPWRYLAIGGLFAAYFILMFEALAITDPVTLAAVFTLTPILTAGFAWALLAQVPRARVTLPLALGAAGALWVVVRADLDALLGLDLDRGAWLYLVGCAAHAAYTPLVAKLGRGEPAAVFGLGALLGGLLATGAYAGPELAATDWAALPAAVWGTVLYLGVLATAGTFFLVRYAALRLPSAKVMAYGYLVPGFVVLWEGLATGAWVAPPVWLGMLAILATLALLLREDRTSGG